MPSKRGGFTFDEVLPRLTVAYARGRLVPFIGVGMSRPACAAWHEMVGGLEKGAGIDLSPPTILTRTDELIRRANRAVRTLWAGTKGKFAHEFRQALFLSTEPVPLQMRALASIWWPLVLTTNYDDFYVKAFAEASRDPRTLAVVGRSSEDCQRVLTSLTVAGRSLLWALQGYVAAPSRETDDRHERRLSGELVIDHDEYRRVTHREPHFRRAFAEVFRTRSLFFLGSGLKETYIQELFGEVLELYGPSTQTHYAIMPSGEVDPQFMFARFQIAVVEYGTSEQPNHGYVPERLNELKAAVERVESAPVAWGFGTLRTDGAVDVGNADLDVIRGPLPTSPTVGSRGDGRECLVLSAGGSRDAGGFYVSRQLRPTLDQWCGWREADRQPSTPLTDFIAEYPDKHAFAVRARPRHDDVKSLAEVRRASAAVFSELAPRYRRINMQLLAAGDDDGSGGARWSARPYPPRFSFMETVRAWGDWRRTHPEQQCRLALYVVDPTVTRELASRRIDILELLNCPDITFWTEQVEDGVLVERRRFQMDDATLLGAIAHELCLDPSQWNVEVSPVVSIGAEEDPDPLNGTRGGQPLLTLPLHALGVVVGSTLHFRRIEDGSRPS